MRTTITLEKDVAARVERLRKDRPLKDLINEALRAGLEHIERKDAPPSAPYSVEPVEGRPKRTNLDNIAEVLAEVEGDSYR
jgi:hypothetical protein